MKSYTLHPSFHHWILNDLDKNQERQLKSHLEAQDYFGTLATVVNLIKQQEGKRGQEDIYDEIIDELTFLQNNYKITTKNNTP